MAQGECLLSGSLPNNRRAQTIKMEDVSSWSVFACSERGLVASKTHFFMRYCGKHSHHILQIINKPSFLASFLIFFLPSLFAPSFNPLLSFWFANITPPPHPL